MLNRVINKHLYICMYNVTFCRKEDFESAYSSFFIWLKDVEERIQCQNKMKLEVNDLMNGLQQLKVSFRI